MYQPSTDLVVTYFPTYLPIYIRPISYRIGNCWLVLGGYPENPDITQDIS